MTSKKRSKASKEPSLESKVTWSQKFTDFSFILKSGQELKCHKFILANNSDFFEAMLTNDMEEAKSNQVKMDHFSGETVVSFLEYLYSETVKSEKTVAALTRDSGDPNKYIYKRSFDEQKLTLELLRMAHMYHVEDLEMDCIYHLKATLTDDNVMTIWKEAQRHNIEDLCETTINHLVVRPKGKTLQEVSGFNETFQDLGKPQKDFLNHLLNKFTERIAQLKENQNIKISVKNAPVYVKWERNFSVKSSDKISTFLEEELEQAAYLPTGREFCLTLTSNDNVNGRIRRDLTFLENSIDTDTTLYLWNTAPDDVW